uniref:sugar transferase n=1 Tax=Trichocoleus desertorum TaxID=1481672 RepID=UPI0025B2D32C|nr:sugar transferase [Trichocoleus desertorum]
MTDFSGRAYKSPKLDIRAPGKLNLSQFRGWPGYRMLALLISDVLALGMAWQIAAHLNQFYSPLPPELNWWSWLGLPSLFWFFAAATLLFFAYGGLYSSATQWKNYLRAGKLVSMVYLLSLVMGYFYDPKLDPPRSLFFTAWLSSVGLVIGFRLLTTLILRQFEQSQSPIPVFLIAPGDRLSALAHVLEKRLNFKGQDASRYRVVGAALATTAHAPTTLQTILASKAKEVLVENLPDTALASALYWQLRRQGITLRLLPSSVDMLHRRGLPEIFAGLPTLRVEPRFLSSLEYGLKRWMDIFGASVGVILLSPLFLTVAIAIKLSSPGPIFFRQERMGLHGKVFQMWKFRTMVTEAEALQAQLEACNEIKGGVMFKIRHDPRITRLGRFLRSTSIDELPQLFNVLLGQMSLVGPRPLPLRDVERFDTWHHIRHQVLPGITGLWQVSGRSDIADFGDAVRLDLYYIDNWSLNLDLDILVETCRIVLFGKGAY